MVPDTASASRQSSRCSRSFLTAPPPCPSALVSRRYLVAEVPPSQRTAPEGGSCRVAADRKGEIRTCVEAWRRLGRPIFVEVGERDRVALCRTQTRDSLMPLLGCSSHRVHAHVIGRRYRRCTSPPSHHRAGACRDPTRSRFVAQRQAQTRRTRLLMLIFRGSRGPTQTPRLPSVQCMHGAAADILGTSEGASCREVLLYQSLKPVPLKIEP